MNFKGGLGFEIFESAISFRLAANVIGIVSPSDDEDIESRGLLFFFDLLWFLSLIKKLQSRFFSDG